MEKRPFQQHISNEDTAKLPAVLFDGPIVIVDDEKQVEAACRDLASSPVLGFDTETRPSFKAGVTYRVALLQLSTPRRCYLFRLNRMRFEKQLVKLLENKAILKIGADVAGDIRSLLALRRFSKAQRLSNWEAAQLTEKQMRYAATDAWICPEIYRTLQHTLKPNDK